MNEEIKKVGKFYDNKARPFLYIDIPFKDKWADATKYLPQEFDLCYCKTEKQIVCGWYTGVSWDGYKINPKDKILFWKLNYDN